MKKQLKRALVLAFGCTFLVLGLLGLFLPFLQGILFIAIGLILLSLYSETFRNRIREHTRRFPKLHAVVEKVQTRVDEIFGDR